MTNIRQSTRQYEDWLHQQLKGDVVKKDLEKKHKKMRSSPFSFLRATYWRWAETVLEVCPDLADAPRVLAVGDIHLENFGTWRDEEGRLVWGVNDCDEAAEMPFALDLVRLATSALLAKPRAIAVDEACSAVLRGYREGLKAPGPIVLDYKYPWLRRLVIVPETVRKDFWDDIEKAEAKAKEAAPMRYRKALAASMPQQGSEIRTARRSAGSGSLGRPRWIGIADWQGAPVVREAKALVVSSWCRPPGRGQGEIRCGEIAKGRHRAPDPWLDIETDLMVRRLSPNNRKIEADDKAVAKLSLKLLRFMGRELANVHLGVADTREAIVHDLDRRERGWLATGTTAMAAAVHRDFQAYGGQAT